MTYVIDPYEVGGHLPVLVTGISQSGDLLGYISGMDIDGICSGQYNKALLLKHDLEQISNGMLSITIKCRMIYSYIFLCRIFP